MVIERKSHAGMVRGRAEEKDPERVGVDRSEVAIFSILSAVLLI